MNSLSISEVATQSNVNKETVRYYEKRGLISAPPRTEAGYRMYPTESVERIKFIKRAQKLGFTLDEIKKIVSISEDEPNLNSNEVLEFSIQKIQEIETQIQDLEIIKSSLKDLVAQCQNSKQSLCRCPIIENLAKGGDQ